MSSFKQICMDYFDSEDLYEVLKVEKDASDKEIKKAYHKLSLLVHPDRVPEAQKQAATEKFKVLGRIYTILQDSDKRKLYDERGEIDEENDAGFNWMEYWRSIFKPISTEDIENYKRDYIGSEQELRDIKKAYVASKGNMDIMHEMIPFINCDSEARIIEICRKMADNEEIVEYKLFFNEPARKRNRRRAKEEVERKECELIDRIALEKEIAENREKHCRDFSDMLSGLEKKYGAPPKRKSLTGAAKEPPTKKKRVLRSKK